MQEVRVSGSQVEAAAILRIITRGKFDDGTYSLSRNVSPVRVRAHAAMTSLGGGTELTGQIGVWTPAEAMLRRLAVALIVVALVGILLPLVVYVSVVVLVVSAVLLLVMLPVVIPIRAARGTAMVDMLDAIADSVDGEILEAGRRRRGIRRVPLLGSLLRFAEQQQEPELRKARIRRDRKRLQP